MPLEDFIDKMKEIFDDETITLETSLPSLDAWDSLSMVSVIAMAKIKCKRELTVPQLQTITTLQELYQLIQSGNGQP